MAEYIFPVIADDEKRTKRLAAVYATLNTKQRSALKSILERQSNSIKNMKLFLEYCDKYNVFSILFMYRGELWIKMKT